uniref:Putative secreted peptide n=1 Tax=Anopheles braziliensis TaxID=58242 RepID=A0A2M3ZQY9_9DIPT
MLSSLLLLIFAPTIFPSHPSKPILLLFLPFHPCLERPRTLDWTGIDRLVVVNGRCFLIIYSSSHPPEMAPRKRGSRGRWSRNEGGGVKLLSIDFCLAFFPR